MDKVLKYNSDVIDTYFEVANVTKLEFLDIFVVIQSRHLRDKVTPLYDIGTYCKLLLGDEWRKYPR